MNKKLTLSINKSVIEEAKVYANKQNRSLSGLVENFLRSLTEEKKIHNQEKEFHPLVMSLRGAFKLPDNFDYDTVLNEMKEKRFREKGIL